MMACEVLHSAIEQMTDPVPESYRAGCRREVEDLEMHAAVVVGRPAFELVLTAPVCVAIIHRSAAECKYREASSDLNHE